MIEQKDKIDDLTEELQKFQVVGLPPKLRYRLQRWLRSIRPNQGVRGGTQPQSRQALVNAVKSELISKLVGSKVEDLKKNEMMASAYSDGSVKLDFGSEVPDSLKKAALNWAKRRGLRAIEASLKKSMDEPESIWFGAESAIRTDKALCVKQVKYSLS